MIASFLIIFREVLEAALVVGIVLTYLHRNNIKGGDRYLWLGVAGGVGLSALGAWLFSLIAGGFTGRNEELFEGFVMLIGAALLTTMIFWMMKEQNQAQKLKDKMDGYMDRGHILGVFFVVLVAVLREGIETVIFFRTLMVTQTGGQWLGAVLGLIAATLLVVLFFFGSKTLKPGMFFRVTNVLLILFAAGMVAYGVHELQEAGLIPVVIEHVYDINPAVAEGGGYPVFHEKGAIGSIFKGLFGYNGNPSLIEIIVYLAYLTGVVLIWRRNS